MSPIFTSNRYRLLVTPEPSLVVREMLEVDVVKDSVVRVNIQIIQIKKSVEVGMLAEATSPFRFS